MHPKIKIGIIANDIRYNIAGSERYLNEVALYLTRKGVDTTLFIIKGKPEKGKMNPNYPLVKKRFASIKVRYIRPDVINFKSLNTSFFFFRNLPRDSILYLSTNLYGNLLNVLGKPAGQKYIIGSHVLQFKSEYQSESRVGLEKSFNGFIKGLLKIRGAELRKTLFFHVINLKQKEYLEREFGIRPENIKYVPIFAKVENYKIGSNNSKVLRVVHIGGRAKNAEFVAAIVKEIAGKKQIGRYEFHFIGSSEPAEVEGFAKRYPNVINHGMVDDKEKARILSQADVLINPSVEAFPLTVLEGLASGLTVVSRRNEANKELRSLGADVISIDRDDPKAFEGELNKLFALKQNGKLARAHKMRNRKVVMDNFSYDVIMPRTLEMFRQVNDA